MADEKWYRQDEYQGKYIKAFLDISREGRMRLTVCDNETLRVEEGWGTDLLINHGFLAYQMPGWSKPQIFTPANLNLDQPLR